MAKVEKSAGGSALLVFICRKERYLVPESWELYTDAVGMY